MVLPGPGTKVAPAGSPETVSESIAGVSGSEAVTSTVSALFSATVAVAGAVTDGGWSPIR